MEHSRWRCCSCSCVGATARPRRDRLSVQRVGVELTVSWVRTDRPCGYDANRILSYFGCCVSETGDHLGFPNSLVRIAVTLLCDTSPSLVHSNCGNYRILRSFKAAWVSQPRVDESVKNSEPPPLASKRAPLTGSVVHLTGSDPADVFEVTCYGNRRVRSVAASSFGALLTSVAVMWRPSNWTPCSPLGLVPCRGHARFRANAVRRTQFPPDQFPLYRWYSRPILHLLLTETQIGRLYSALFRQNTIAVILTNKETEKERAWMLSWLTGPKNTCRRHAYCRWPRVDPQKSNEGVFTAISIYLQLFLKAVFYSRN